MRLPGKYKPIWDAALSYQDKRDDKGHAEVVTRYAIRLSKLLGADPDIAVPAAILRDIGWSQLADEERFIIFRPNAGKEDKLAARLRHQAEGVRLAGEILASLNYPPEKTEKILNIISQHDTREGFISKEEGVMRDADKLWRFDKKGYFNDFPKFRLPPVDYYFRMKAELGTEGYFYSELSKELASNELDRRYRQITETQD
jgi:HD superfamily phosphodiesterase